MQGNRNVIAGALSHIYSQQGMTKEGSTKFTWEEAPIGSFNLDLLISFEAHISQNHGISGDNLDLSFGKVYFLSSQYSDACVPD